MGRMSKDPALSAIVRGMKDVEFAPPINPDRQPLGMHVYNFPGKPKRPFAVRYCIAGIMRTLGAFSSRDNAARFADMVTLRFWKYRGRDFPKAFNYSETQAMEDTKSNETAAYILAQVELHLSESLVVYTGSGPKTPRAPRVTIHNRIAKLEAENEILKSRIAALESKQNTIIFDGGESPVIKPFESSTPVNIWQTKSTNER